MRNQKLFLALAVFVVAGAIFCLAGLPSAKAAVSWYVDANVSTTGTGTGASPFKTITEAVNAAGDGDTIYLKNGTYSPSTNGEPIPIPTINRSLTIEGQDRDQTIINGEIAGSGDIHRNIMAMRQPVELKNLTVKGFSSDYQHPGIYAWASTRVTIDNCSFDGTVNGSDQGATAVYLYDVNESLVRDSSFSHFTYYGLGILGVYENTAVSVTDSQFTHFQGTEFSEFPAAVVPLCMGANKRCSVDISSNTFDVPDDTPVSYGVYGYSVYTSEGTFIFDQNTLNNIGAAYAIITYGSKNSFQVSNNLVKGPSSRDMIDILGIGLTIWGWGGSENTGDLYNNVIANGSYSFILGESNIMGAPPAQMPALGAPDPIDNTIPILGQANNHFTVRNNSIDHSANAGILGFGNGNTATHIVAQNNSISNSAVGLSSGDSNLDYGLTIFPHAESFVSDYNNLYHSTSDNYYTVGAGSHDQISNPDYFQAYDNNEYDLHIRGGSPLVGAANQDYCPATDIDGNNRPTDRGCDIGAYEVANFRMGNGYVVTSPASNGGPQYQIYKLDGTKLDPTIIPYDKNMRGEFKSQVIDVNRDGMDEIITFPGEGSGPHLKIYKKDGTLLTQAFVYDKAFRGGLNVAVDDFNADGQYEIAAAPASGGSSQVKVYRFDQGKLKVMADFQAYNDDFHGGVNLAVGNTDGSDRSSLITVPASGGGPDVRIYKFHENKFDLVANTLAYANSFRGGVSLVSLDMDSDGQDEIVTAPLNGSSHLRFFRQDGRVIEALGSTFVYDKNYRGGIKMAAGDVNGDGLGEVVVAPATRGGPHIRVYGLYSNGKVKFLDGVMIYDRSFHNGINLAVGDLNDDGRAEVVVAPAGAAKPNIRVLTFTDKLHLADWFWAYGQNFPGGVNISIGARL